MTILGIPYNVFWAIVTLVVGVLIVVMIIVLSGIGFELKERNRLLVLELDLLQTIANSLQNGK